MNKNDYLMHYGARVATLTLGANNIYQHVEQARAIEQVKANGRFDLKKR